MARVVGLLDRVMAGLYFRWAYHPTPVPVLAPPTGLPVEHNLASVPWIVEDKPVCQSVATQMIAARYGAHRSRAEIDFLMGFTYGAGYRADWGFLTVGVDPETGIATAAPYLGHPLLATRLTVASPSMDGPDSDARSTTGGE